ncbi:MAG: helix-turn-helix transcriptional regulator [Lachnospiraceae bacterium]|nr:helix-turn-helix transcriptional regulator [Lachnospiraceae bacterium]
MTVNERITQLRVSKGWSVNKLANMAGISQAYLRDVELGNKKPSVEIISLICGALKISLATFFSYDNDNTFKQDPLIEKIYLMTPEQRKALAAFIDTLSIN